MKQYSVKEIYYTLQGEGAQTGRAAVFLRFAGCNLWSGLERDRASAVCQFCDTDFVGMDGPGGGRFEAAELATRVQEIWSAHTQPAQPAQSAQMRPHPQPRARPYVVCTGGEPALQLDRPLIDAIHAAGFEIAIETNGTIALPDGPDGIDWICVSPKAGTTLVQHTGNELKLVYPQTEAMPDRFEALAFDHFFIQPMDGPRVGANTSAAIEWCRANPQWRLSLQTHKVLNIA